MYKLILYDESSRLPLREITGFASKQETRQYRQDISIGTNRFWHVVESEPYTKRPLKRKGELYD